MSDYNIIIDTPENLTLEADIAGFGSRCIAAMIDYLILLLLIIVLGILANPFYDNIEDQSGAVIGALIFLVQFVIFTFYHLLFEFIWNGQTPGKRLFGLRVVQANGMPVTVSGILVRNIVRLFDFLPFSYGIGLAVMFFSKRSQRFGDIAARTVVVYEHPAVKLDSLLQQTAVQFEYVTREADIPAYVDIDALSAQDIEAIYNYLGRRKEIKYTGIATLLAQRFAGQMMISDLSQLERQGYAERFLEDIIRAHEQGQTIS